MKNRRLLSLAVAFGLMTLLAACGKHYLDEYRFSQRALALVFIDPPAPELLHGWYWPRADRNAIQNVLGAGGTVVKEIEARKASARFDTAARRVDIEALLARRTLDRVSRYLGTRIVQSADEADYVLELSMRSFGVDARSNNATYLFARAEAVLIERRSGREIWSESVRGSDRLTPYVVGGRNAPSAIFTAVTLHQVTVADFQEALEQLATYTSSWITAELREDLREVRETK